MEVKEVWKDIGDYNGLYQVSNYGRVKSSGKKSNHKGAIILKQATIQGYKMVTLTKNSKGKMFKVHRLVALAFIPNPENKPQVNHIDGNKNNNHVSNLEWCTAKENCFHAEKLKLRYRYSGKENKKSIQIKQIDDLTGEVVAVYGSLREMERETGFTRTSISRSLGSSTKRPYGWKWEKC